MSKSTRQVFFLHLIYSLLEGALFGICTLNEFVLSKSLRASSLHLGIYFQLSVIALVFSVFFDQWVRRIRHQRRFLLVVALSTRLPLLLMLTWPHFLPELRQNTFYHYTYLALFFAYFLSSPIIFPLVNQFLKQHYGSQMGKLFGYSTLFNHIMAMGAGYGFGYLLDIHPTAFIYVYPVMAIMGIASILTISTLSPPPREGEIPKESLGQAVKKALRRAWDTFVHNRSYYHYQIGFFAYGVSFLMSWAVVVFLLDKVLQLDYAIIAAYKAIPGVVSIMTVPLFGRLIDRFDPRRSAQLGFGFLALYFVCLILTFLYPAHHQFNYAGTSTFPVYYFLAAGYFFFGLFAGCLSILWNIGSTYFCRPDEAATYQSIHLTLTGLRGLGAPLLGVGVYYLFGFVGAFAASLALLIFAIIWLQYSISTTPLPIVDK